MVILFFATTISEQLFADKNLSVEQPSLRGMVFLMEKSYFGEDTVYLDKCVIKIGKQGG